MAGARKTGIVLHTDGGSRGNPGPSAAAAVALEGGRVVASEAKFLGTTTNNVAEYEGLLLALALARKLELTDVRIATDSELLVRQYAGVYRMKAAHLRPLLERARREAAAFRSVQVTHVPREENADADALVNETLDAAGSTGGQALHERLVNG